MTYQEARNTIINALMNRPAGTEIQPQNHQDAELAILDYAKTIMQAVEGNVFVDFTYFTQQPFIPENGGYSLYIGYIAPSAGVTKTLNYFFDLNGNTYTITTSENEFVLAFLLWNGTYWDLMQCRIPISRSGEGTEVILYGSTGQNRDGAMTQKATTDALATKQDTLTAGRNITITNDNYIIADTQMYNAVSPGSNPPRAGELLEAGSLVVLNKDTQKIYKALSEQTRAGSMAIDPYWGLALVTNTVAYNAVPLDVEVVQQGLLAVTSGMLYNDILSDGAAYFIGFTEDTLSPTQNQSSIVPTGKLYTFAQLEDAGIYTYMYVGRGIDIRGDSYIQLDLSAHMIISRDSNGAITHINGASTGVTPMSKQAVLNAFGYSEITMKIKDSQNIERNVKIIGQIIS